MGRELWQSAFEAIGPEAHYVFWGCLIGWQRKSLPWASLSNLFTKGTEAVDRDTGVHSNWVYVTRKFGVYIRKLHACTRCTGVGDDCGGAAEVDGGLQTADCSCCRVATGSAAAQTAYTHMPKRTTQQIRGNLTHFEQRFICFLSFWQLRETTFTPLHWKHSSYIA